jgi:hypothetical protein
MMLWIPTLSRQPGGWLPTVLFEEYPWTIEAEKSRAEWPVGLVARSAATHLFFFVLIPSFLGLYFIWAIYFAIVLPVVRFFVMSALRRRLFGDVPPNSACLFPKNEVGDSRRKYVELVIKVTAFWLTTILVFSLCILSLWLAMGQQWNMFTRTIELESGDFLKIYEMVDFFLLVSGFFAISGLLWWPMFVPFEWLGLRSKTGKMRGLTHA